MKPVTLVSSLFTVTGLTSAQYFSAGWTPGQPVPTVATNAEPQSTLLPETNGKRRTTPSQPSFLDNLLTNGPLTILTSAIGLDTTGGPPMVWDERIPLITDSNYGDLIVNEEMTPEEEDERVWFIVITTTAGQPQGVSKFVDESFDAAYNYTLEKDDLKHVRFGRVDYLDVTVITTKWAVWRPPTFVVLKDRGNTLRFYRAGQVRLSAEVLYQFLKEEGWRQKDPWTSVYGPGGDREWVLDHYALALAAVYSYLVRVPKWLMYMISGGVATFLINFLHKPTAQQQSKAKTDADRKQVATTPTSVAGEAGGNRIAPSTPVSETKGKTTASTGPKTPSKRRGKK